MAEKQKGKSKMVITLRTQSGQIYQKIKITKGSICSVLRDLIRLPPFFECPGMEIEEGDTFGDYREFSIQRSYRNKNSPPSNILFECHPILSHTDKKDHIAICDVIDPKNKELFISFSTCKTLIIFHQEQCWDITDTGHYPEGVTRVIVKCDVYKNLPEFPNTVNTICFIDGCGHFGERPAIKFPKSLTCLVLGRYFTHPIHRFPESLTSLRIETGYRGPIPESTEKMKVVRF